MSERRKKLIPDDQRDFELARRIDIDANKAKDMGKHSPTFEAILRMEHTSVIAKGIHGISTASKKPTEKNAIPAPRGMAIIADKSRFPAPVKKEVVDNPETKRLLKVANKRIEILEDEKQQLVDAIETLKKAYIELRDKPSDLKAFLERRGFSSVDELERFILNTQESRRKTRERQERYNRKRYG